MADNKNNPNQVSDTGHEWDGIRELDNPCPRWWLNALYLSGALVLFYFIWYPSLPLVDGSTKGVSGWTQIKEYKEDLAKIDAKRAPFENKVSEMTLDEIIADPEMLSYVVGSSKVLYGDNCAACHGVGGVPAEGSGYPILADDDWLYGGDVYTIATGIAAGRQGMMPAHEGMLTEQELDGLVQFVVDSANGQATDEGWALYSSKGCVACHGADAKGVQALGSANLTDQIWRFSGEPEEIKHTILYGVNQGHEKTRVAVMPAWSEKYAVMLEEIIYAIEEEEDPNEIDWDDVLEGDEAERLSVNEIKKLAVYVHQLGGGQ